MADAKKKTAAAARADAATTEHTASPRTLEYDGLVLEGLPAKLPFRLLKALYDIRTATQGANADPSAIVGLIATILPEQQMDRFWTHFGDRDMDDADTILTDFVQAIFELYGTTPGESSASSGS